MTDIQFTRFAIMIAAISGFIVGTTFGVLSLTIPGEWTTIYGQKFKIVRVN